MNKCDAILTFDNQQLFSKPVERAWCISGHAHIMNQTRDSVNNALYVKAILNHFLHVTCDMDENCPFIFGRKGYLTHMCPC